MSDNSAIEWTDATWNPIRAKPSEAGLDKWYCRKISPGCDNCYASTMNHRWGGREYPPVPGVLGGPAVYLDDRVLMQPHRWKQPRMVFVCSMTDIAGEWVDFEWFHAMWTVMAETPRHTYQVLTKRPSRLRDFIERFQEDAPGFGPFPLPNVWVGSTIESNAYTWRANVLRQTPAAIRWVSAEPMIGPITSLDLTDINWLVVGGESGGPRHRSLVAQDRSPRLDALDWVRLLRDGCSDVGTAFFFKQWGGRTPKAAGRLLDGRTHDDYPSPAGAAERGGASS